MEAIGGDCVVIASRGERQSGFKDLECGPCRGNRRLNEMEYFHMPGMPEYKRSKVTALNLFHPTASPFSKKSVFLYYDTVSGERIG
jgi:hypothetical protein